MGACAARRRPDMDPHLFGGAGRRVRQPDIQRPVWQLEERGVGGDRRDDPAHQLVSSRARGYQPRHGAVRRVVWCSQLVHLCAAISATATITSSFPAAHATTIAATSVTTESPSFAATIASTVVATTSTLAAAASPRSAATAMSLPTRLPAPTLAAAKAAIRRSRGRVCSTRGKRPPRSGRPCLWPQHTGVRYSL